MMHHHCLTGAREVEMKRPSRTGRTPAGVLRELAGNVEDYHAIVYAQPSTDRRVRLEDEQVGAHSRGVSDLSDGPYWLSSIEPCVDCKITW
jgi:hypothetical protein